MASHRSIPKKANEESITLCVAPIKSLFYFNSKRKTAVSKTFQFPKDGWLPMFVPIIVCAFDGLYVRTVVSRCKTLCSLSYHTRLTHLRYKLIRIILGPQYFD